MLLYLKQREMRLLLHLQIKMIYVKRKLQFQRFQILVVSKVSFAFNLYSNIHTWQNYQVPKVPEFLEDNIVASCVT